MPRMLDPAAIAHQIDLLKAGYRFCACCGFVKIGPVPLEPEWRSVCSECWAAGKRPYDHEFCGGCGTQLPSSWLESAKRNKRRIYRCLYCSKGSPYYHCDRCGVFHPETWHRVISLQSA